MTEPRPTLFIVFGATGDLCKRRVLRYAQGSFGPKKADALAAPEGWKLR